MLFKTSLSDSLELAVIKKNDLVSDTVEQTLVDELFLTYVTKFILFLAVLENSVLSTITRDTKSDVSCLKTSFTRRSEKLRMTFRIGRHTTLIVNKCYKPTTFEI